VGLLCSTACKKVFLLSNKSFVFVCYDFPKCLLNPWSTWTVSFILYFALTIYYQPYIDQGAPLMFTQMKMWRWKGMGLTTVKFVPTYRTHLWICQVLFIIIIHLFTCGYIVWATSSPAPTSTLFPLPSPFHEEPFLHFSPVPLRSRNKQ
jgi:hypothetical protein